LNFGQTVPIRILLPNFGQNFLRIIDIVVRPVLAPLPKLLEKCIEFHSVLIADTQYGVVNQNWELAIWDVDVSYEVLPRGGNESVEHLSSKVDKYIIELCHIVLSFQFYQDVSFVHNLVDRFLQRCIRVGRGGPAMFVELVDQS
jgi:hypothetical protein